MVLSFLFSYYHSVSVTMVSHLFWLFSIQFNTIYHARVVMCRTTNPSTNMVIMVLTPIIIRISKDYLLLTYLPSIIVWLSLQYWYPHVTCLQHYWYGQWRACIDSNIIPYSSIFQKYSLNMWNMTWMWHCRYWIDERGLDAHSLQLMEENPTQKVHGDIIRTPTNMAV